MWVRADSVNGYFCDFNVYTGRSESGDTENGLGERVVFELTECLRGGNYHIYCDNYFTTCRLLDTLLTHKIYGCGTARTARREFPETLKQVRLERGAHLFCQRGSLVASVWMDKKPVTMLSTLAQADATHTAQRRQRDWLRVSVQCPDAVVLYNQYMAGVDKGDQYRQYYRVRTKCNKNYKYIFWFLFDVAITNSYILSTFTPTCAPVSHLPHETCRGVGWQIPLSQETGSSSFHCLCPTSHTATSSHTTPSSSWYNTNWHSAAFPITPTEKEKVCLLR